MAGNEYGVRFTEQMYATRQDVARVLNTQLIDNIWQNILNYRSSFTRVLSLRNINHAPFRITYSPTVVERINIVERKFSKSVSSFGKLENNPREKFAVRRYIYSQVIKHLAFKEGIEISDSLVSSIFNGENAMYDDKQQKIFNYIATLKNFEAHSADPLNEDFFFSIYSKITNNLELVSLYREKELDTTSQRLLIGREYTAAPVAAIPSMMDNLQDFIANSEQTFFVKAVAGFYAINLIKPFDEFNDEISILALKCGISHGEVGEIAALFPFETLICEKSDLLKQAVSETTKSNDLTYILVFVMDCIDEIVQSTLDALTNYQIDAAKDEFRRDEQIAPTKVEHQQQPEQSQVVVAKKDAPSPTIKEETIKQNPTLTKIDVVKDDTKSIPVSSIEFAIPKESFQIDEKDAQRYEEYLLESEPTLKRGQAHFFARHCAIGKYYTIQQYKRSIGVVYETARTSMEVLVKLGYYRKEQIKNKFVYTPVKKD